MNAQISFNPSRLPHTVASPRPLKHIVWVNEHAAFVGGAEQYIHETAALFKADGVENTLLYDPLARFDTNFLTPFSRAYPLIRPWAQIEALKADIVYVHRVSGAERVRQIADATDRAVRFFHDHRSLCLREHKYTTIRQETCDRSLGLHCYACLGFLGKKEGVPTFRTLGPLLEELEESQRLAGAVVASRYLKTHLIDHGFDRDKISVAPLYAGLATSIAMARNPKQMLFVGQLVRGKGVDILLQAMTQLAKDVRLVVAGSGAQELELHRMASTLGLDERVDFLGDKRDLDRDRLIASSGALILPSRAPETFGLVGLEAWRFSTPVIATNVGGIPEWLVNGDGGLLVPPNDALALAAAIRLLTDTPDYARFLGTAGRDRWRSRFQPQHHLTRLRECFERTMA